MIWIHWLGIVRIYLHVSYDCVCECLHGMNGLVLQMISIKLYLDVSMWLVCLCVMCDVVSSLLIYFQMKWNNWQTQTHRHWLWHREKDSVWQREMWQLLVWHYALSNSNRRLKVELDKRCTLSSLSHIHLSHHFDLFLALSLFLSNFNFPIVTLTFTFTGCARVSFTRPPTRLPYQSFHFFFSFLLFFNKTHTRHNDCEFIYSAFEILFEFFSIYFFLALINKCEFNSFSLTWVHTETNTHTLLNCDAFLSFPTENQMVSRWLRYGLTCIKRIAHPQLYILYTIAHICRLLRFFVVA